MAWAPHAHEQQESRHTHTGQETGIVRQCLGLVCMLGSGWTGIVGRPWPLNVAAGA